MIQQDGQTAGVSLLTNPPPAGVSGTHPVDLTSDVTGTLPIAKGGTNSSTGLGATAGKLMVSNGAGKIVETANITAVGTLLDKVSTLKSGTVAMVFLDSNGVPLLTLFPVSSAVNQLQIRSNTAGNPVILQPTGPDDDIDLNLGAKGDGVVRVAVGSLIISLGDLDLLAGSLAINDGHAHFGTEQAVTSSAGTATVDWTNSNKQKLTLSENVSTLNFTAPGGAASLTLRIIQDTTARTIAWPAAVKWPGGTAPTLSTGSGDIDLITFYFDGTNYFGGFLQDFS